MARRIKEASHANHERWLVSYADFITLLFAFFVVMFASSQSDAMKRKQFSDSVREALDNGGLPAVVREVLGGTVDDKGQGNAMMKGPGGTEPLSKQPAVAELMPSMRWLSAQLKEEVQAGKIQLDLQPRGLVISLRQAAFFPSGEDAVAPETLPSLDKIAATIRQLPNPVHLEGHTDSVPIHTARFRTNWELSAARGIAVLDILNDRFGVARERLAIAGYADTVPVDSNETEQGRARNRRVDIVILSQYGLADQPVPAPRAAVPPTPVSGRSANGH